MLSTPTPAPQPIPHPIPEPTPPPKKTPLSTILLSIVLLIIIVGALIAIIFFDQLARHPIIQNWIKEIPTTSKNNIILPPVPPSPTPKPTPSYLHPGKETYNVSQNAVGNLPKIASLTLDPLDVKIGDHQSIDVTINSSTPIQSVNLTIYEDDKNIQTVPLTQSSTTGPSSVWHGTLILNYSVLYRYVIMITATNGSGENKAYVAVRTVGQIKKSELE